MEPLNKNNIIDILPLTPLQSVLLVSYLGEPDGNHYKEITRYRIEGNTSMDMIKKAIMTVVSEHEMLRTVFRWQNLREPVQIVLKEKAVPVQQYECFQDKELLEEAMVEELEQKSFKKPLDLRVNPIKFDIYRTREDRYYLTIINHHILFDGWSNSILLGELYQVLCQLEQKKPVIFKEKAGFRDYLEFLKKRDKREDVNFWKKYLYGINKRTLLPGIQYYLIKEKQEKLLSHKEDISIYREVKAFSAKLFVSAAAVFYTAWGLTYYQASRQSDVIFGVAFDGRPAEIKNINQTIGLFMNSLPLRITIKETETIEAVICQVNSSLLEIREHQYTSYFEIAAQSQIKPAGTLYDSVIIIQNYPVNMKLLTGQEDITLSLHARKITTGTKLTIEIRTFGGFFIDVSYQEGYYREETVTQLVNQYRELLLCIIKEKKTTVKDILYSRNISSQNIIPEGGEYYDDF